MSLVRCTGVAMLLVLAIVFLPSLPSRADGPLVGAVPLIRNYTADELGTAAKIKCLLETPEGILYAGADRLLIFDGSSWGQARVDNTPEILSLCEQGERLWIGGVNEIGYYKKGRDGKMAYTSSTARLGAKFYGAVLRILWTGQYLVFVTERKVITMDPDAGIPKIWELPNDRRLRAFFSEGAVYINQPTPEGAKAWVLKNGALEPDHSLMGKNGQARTVIGQLGKEWILGAGYNLYARDIYTGEERCVYTDDGYLKKASPSAGSSICMDDYVYVGTNYSGVLLVNSDGKVHPITRESGLLSDLCLAIATSRARGVWVASDEGISFIHQAKNASLFPLSDPIRAVFGVSDDLIVTTIQAASRFSTEGKSEIAIPRLSLARLDTELYGASRGKIFKIKKKPFVAEEWKDVWGGAGGAVIAGRNSDRILYTMSPKGVSRIDTVNGQETNVEVHEIPYNILQDGGDCVWISTQAGSVLMLDEKLEKVTVQLSGRKRAALALHGGEPIVLYDDTGFVTVKGEPIRGTEKMNSGRGTEDGDGPCWLYARNDELQRLGVVMRDSGGLRWQIKNIPGLRRFKNVNVLYRNGTDLWIGGDTGVIRVDTTKLEDPVLTLPEIADITVRNSKEKTQRALSTTGREFNLEHGEREISLHFKTHVWGLLEPPHYESRLLPLEDEWTRHAYGEVIARKNLPTGQYTLQLRARHLGETGAPTEFKVWCKPPWYFSYAGITLLALACSTAFYGAVRLRTRQVEARNRILEEKISQRTQELAKANAAKSEFLAAMSHEIRNPMNGVIGITKILQEAKLGPREKYYLTTLHRCAEQLRTTVDDVLDFSKIEAGEITLHPDTFDLAEALHSTVAAVDLVGDRLELNSWAGPRPVVTGDQGKFAQILTNYFTNALKYGVPPHATIDVFVLTESDKRCRVTVAVKNSAPDLSPAELATLFESFTRGESARKRRIGGSGLGLSICKRYAEAMGGAVSATSAGGTTVFQLTLPFELSVAREKPSDEVEAPRKLHARALAIEDEDYNRLVLGSILTKLGYKVDWACDGKTALQLAEQNGYDLVLTDWMLPDTDGGTLTRKILAVCEEPKPPVFAVSAYSTKEKEAECVQAGMAGFIAKPITIEKLEAALQTWTARRKGGVTIAVELAETDTPITLNQLARLGPIEVILPDFVKKVEGEWILIDRMLEDRECGPAADAAHKMISAMLLVEARVLCDQLRLLENRLRHGGLESEIEKVRQICREEIARVTKALIDALKRRQRINEARSPK